MERGIAHRFAIIIGPVEKKRTCCASITVGTVEPASQRNLYDRRYDPDTKSPLGILLPACHFLIKCFRLRFIRSLEQT